MVLNRWIFAAFCCDIVVGSALFSAERGFALRTSDHGADALCRCRVPGAADRLRRLSASVSHRLGGIKQRQRYGLSERLALGLLRDVPAMLEAPAFDFDLRFIALGPEQDIGIRIAHARCARLARQ